MKAHAAAPFSGIGVADAPDGALTATSVAAVLGEATPLTPDLVMTERFLDLLEHQGKFHFQTVLEYGPNKGGAPKVLFGTLNQRADKLIELNMQRHAVWVQINSGTGRKATDITAVRSYFVDNDNQVAHHAGIEYDADIVVETSPGKFHYYWLTANVPLDQFKSRQNSLRIRLNGDPRAVDLSRVMRLPGFYHMKGVPFMSRIVYVREGL